MAFFIKAEFLYRLAVLQKWREKSGPHATYRNLAKRFYDAGRPDLVIVTLCEVMKQVPVSQATAAMQTRTSSLTWTFRFLFCVIVVSSVLLASYFFVPDNSQSGRLQSLSSVNSDTGNAGTEVASICSDNKTNEVAPNDLPHFPKPFIGRDKEVEHIVRLLPFAEHSHTKMVHIFGLPAVGKSTLAVHVGYEMARRGIAVRYINADETHVFKNHEHNIVTESHDQRTSSALSKRVSDIELFWYSHTNKKYVSTSPQGLIEWAKGLSNETILIIDNCDSILQSNATQKKFIESLGDLNMASRFLHIVTTGRLKISLLDGFKLYKLKPLDNESAIELLQSVSDAMTLNDSRTVNELVGGIPLALKIVGSLVSETHPSDLIVTKLKENLIETLTPEDVRPEREKLRPVLELSFKYLDTDSQECALYLSHFPGSFSHEAALHMITINKLAECMNNLADRSLLDQYSYADQHRYKFHKLIREYIIGVESEFPIASAAFRLFNFSFVSYYTQVLSSFVTIYNESPHDEENIDRFEHESHNFECLLEKVHFHPCCLSFVSISRSLTCSLMLETFTTSELLKVGQKILVRFENGMDRISTQIGASETLIVYRDLMLALTLWIHSFPAENWSALCNETFEHHDFARIQTIYKQLGKDFYNAHHYFRKLKFLYSSLSYNVDYASVETVILLFPLACCFVSMVPYLLTHFYVSFLVLFIIVGMSIIVVFLRGFLVEVFYVTMFVGLRPIDFLLPSLRTTKYKNLVCLLSNLYCILLCTFIFGALRENFVKTVFASMFLLICDIFNLFINGFNALHLFILIIIVAYVYIFEFDIVHILSLFQILIMDPYDDCIKE